MHTYKYPLLLYMFFMICCKKVYKYNFRNISTLKHYILYIRICYTCKAMLYRKPNNNI